MKPRVIFNPTLLGDKECVIYIIKLPIEQISTFIINIFPELEMVN